jgi:hypothetical protein
LKENDEKRSEVKGNEWLEVHVESNLPEHFETASDFNLFQNSTAILQSYQRVYRQKLKCFYDRKVKDS